MTIKLRVKISDFDSVQSAIDALDDFLGPPWFGVRDELYIYASNKHFDLPLDEFLQFTTKGIKK